MHVHSEPGLQVRFRGVRGSIPTPDQDCLRHGGNTACVEVRSGDDLLIFDAGTGIRQLGLALDPTQHIHLFFSHFHWDHLQGLPYFAPLYHGDARITCYSVVPPGKLRAVLAAQMSAPCFPIAFDQIAAQLDFVQTGPEALRIGECEVLPIPLHHPQGASGYRVQAGGNSLVYATDHEPGTPLDRGLVEAARGAGLLILDAHYTPAEFEQHCGWGHGTWQHAAQLAGEAGVRQLALFHHAPGRTDDQLDALVAEARRHFPETFAAAEETLFVL